MYIAHGVGSDQSTWTLTYNGTDKLVLTIKPNDGSADVVANFTKDA